MFNHKVIQTYADDSGTVQSVQLSLTGQNNAGFDGTVPATTTGFLIDMAVPHTTIQAMELYSSQAVAIKTNSDTSPAQTFNLAAGQMLMWGVGSYTANPITADITAVYVDNAGANPATVKIRFLTS